MRPYGSWPRRASVRRSSRGCCFGLARRPRRKRSSSTRSLWAIGLDPAVALAFFVHESQCGTAGLCQSLDLKNWGMVRTAFDARRGVQLLHAAVLPVHELGSWSNRLVRAHAAALRRGKGAGHGRGCAGGLCAKSDGNAPAAYARKVAELVASWQREDAAADGAHTQMRPYNVIAGIDFAAVREGRSTGFPIALHGACKLSPGTIISIDDITDGWAHLATGEGFVSMSLLEAA